MSPRSPAASGASESPGNTPGAALKKRSLKANPDKGGDAALFWEITEAKEKGEAAEAAPAEAGAPPLFC